MKLKRSFQVALLGVVLVTRVLAQTEADISSLLPKAQRGNAIAQYNLGLAYLNGKGIAADPIEAYVWLSLAHEGGFHGKALSVVAAGLDPADFETARKRLVERRASLNLKLAPATPAKAESPEPEPAMPVVRTETKPAAVPASSASTPEQNSNQLIQELASAVADKQQLSGELSKSWSETEELKKRMTETQATADFLTAETSKLHGERDALTAKLNALTAENATLRTERDNARALGVQAEAQKASFESSLKEMQASAATDKKWLGDELTKSFQEVTALKAQLAAAKNEASAAPAYPDLREQVASLKAEASQAQEQIAALTQARNAAEKSLAQMPAAPTYPDLSDKVKELESSLSAITAEATSAKQEATRLADERIEREKQLIAVQQQSADAVAAHAALQQEVQNLRKAAATPVAPAYPDLSAKVKELEANASILSAKAAAAQQQATDLAAARTALQQEVERLRTVAATPVAPAYPDLREQVASLESQVVSLKSDVSRANNQIATLSLAKQAAEKSLALASAAPAYPDLSGKVKELEGSLSTLSTKATAAQQEATRLADDRIEREKQLISLQQQATELATARDSLQQENQNLRNAAAIPAKPGYPDLREQVSSLEAQIVALKTDANDARQQITALSRAKDAAEKSLTKLPPAPAYPDLSGKVKELEGSLVALSTKATAAQQEAARLADERIEREKQLISLQQQATELAAARDGLQQENQNLRKAAATPAAPAYPDLRDQVSSLESRLAAAQKEAGRQTTELTEAKAALEKASTASAGAPVYPDLSGKVRELESSLAAQTEAAEKSRAALQAMQASPAQPASTAPAYPDLSDKVKELESALAARSADAGAADKSAEELRQAKTDAEQKLAAAEQSRKELSQQFEEFKRSAVANQRENLNRQAQITMLEAEKAALRQQSNADQTRLADLSSQLAASRRKAEEVYPTAPAYPDQRARVEQLEAELTKTNEQANGMIAVLNRSQQEAKTSAEQIEQLRATVHDLENKAAAVAPAYPDLREQVSNLEIQLEAARALPKTAVSPAEFNNLKQELADTKLKLATTLKGYALIEKERDDLASRSAAPAAAPAPDYPDLRDKVATLEAALKSAKSAAPAYPDLREQVSNMQIQLDAARSLPKNHISPQELSDVKQELADTKEKLATTLRGYSLIEKERDELANKPDRAGSNQSDVARLTEAYNALQRANVQTERELALLRAQVQETPNANASLAQQNIPKVVPVTPRVIPASFALGSPVVASAPAPAPRRTHVIAAGDTLVKISQRYYGNTNSWQAIYDANRELLGPKGTLKVGAELRIP